jgi:hypothetical protein
VVRGRPRQPLRETAHPCHGKGKRYLARWRGPDGRQHKQRFTRKRDADQHLANVETDKATGTYIDPNAGKVTFREYAEQWRTTRTHDLATAERIEREFRLHVYEDPEHRGKTPRGGIAIGQHQIGALSRLPSVLQVWIKSLPMSASSARMLVVDVGQVFNAAVDDSRIAKTR